MTGREVVSGRTHKRGNMVVSGSRVNIWPVIHVLWVPISDSRIECLVCSNGSDTGPTSNTTSSWSLRLRLDSFSCPFLVCLGFLQLKKAFLQWVHWILLLKLMLFNALDHSLQGSQLSFIDLILKKRKIVKQYEMSSLRINSFSDNLLSLSKSQYSVKSLTPIMFTK